MWLKTWPGVLELIQGFSSQDRNEALVLQYPEVFLEFQRQYQLLLRLPKAKSQNQFNQFLEPFLDIRTQFSEKLFQTLWRKLKRRTKKYYPKIYADIQFIESNKTQAGLSKIETLKFFVQTRQDVMDIFTLKSFHLENRAELEEALHSKNQGLYWDLQAKKDQWQFLDPTVFENKYRLWVNDHLEDITPLLSQPVEVLFKDEHLEQNPLSPN